MNKTIQIENIILDILSDGEYHTITEFKQEIQKVNPELLIVPNSLSSVLYQMRIKKKQVDKQGRGLYILSSENKIIEKKNNDNKEVYTHMLKLWREFYGQNNILKNASYEMNDEEFMEGKKMYELNKKIEALLKTYL